MQLIRTKSRAKQATPTADRLQQLQRENEALRRQVAEFSRFRELAYCDALTGLRNRRFLEERLCEELARTRRNAKNSGMVLLIDLDRFKQINDTHGHQAGDEALRFVAQLLYSVFRETDVCARTGGDEFVVLMPETSRAGGKKAIQRLRAKLEEANAQREIPVYLSVGAALYPGGGNSVATVLEQADRAMYQEKARHHRAEDQAAHKKSAA